MNDYYAYEIFDSAGGYCLFIHINEDTCDNFVLEDLDPDHDHYRIGTVHNCESLQDAIQHVVNGDWDYEEHNA